tara:strand:- start:1567 stop:1722 length:156 start_codon:yes stop_codon:yes gene_type:complete
MILLLFTILSISSITSFVGGYFLGNFDARLELSDSSFSINANNNDNGTRIQ